MAANEDIAKIIEQEKMLVFPAFDEETAFALGTLAREIAIAEGLGVVIDVRLWNRPLFYAALPGSTAANPEWARRKINVVQRLMKSTYRLVLEQERPDRAFAPFHAMPIEDYVLAGGGFPITVKGAGVIGAIAVSGLPEREDHNLVVGALCKHLGQDEAGLALSGQD